MQFTPPNSKWYSRDRKSPQHLIFVLPEQQLVDFHGNLQIAFIHKQDISFIIPF